MNISCITLKRVIWRFQIYNLFLEKFEFRGFTKPFKNFGKYIIVFIFAKFKYLKPALDDIRISSWFLLVIRVTYDKRKISFWYIAYYVYNLVYLCRLLIEQQIELALNFLKNKKIFRIVN